MNVLSVEGLNKFYGERPIVQDLSFGLNQGEKVALVARNGAGKSTLLRVLAGEEPADSGAVVWRKGLEVGYLPQQPVLPPELTVREALIPSQGPVQQALADYAHALDLQAQNHPQAEQYLTAALEAMDREQAWDWESRRTEYLDRLGLAAVAHQPIGLLSGGQQRRLAMAKLLLGQPQVLLLDEPTNHLDIEMVEWLEEQLKPNNLTLLLVTHDRYFLDNVCNRIVELEGSELVSYPGAYDEYLARKAERQAQQARTQDRLTNLYKRELDWMRRQPKARGTKSRKRQEQFESLEQEVKKPQQQEVGGFRVKMTPIGSKILELKKLRKAYGELTILDGFSYTFRKGERLGLVGRNGTGKTTFLNILLGLEAPDSGKIELGETIVPGYFRQTGGQWKPGEKVIDYVKRFGESLPMADGGTLSASQFLFQFQFSATQQQMPVELLSGGEQRRLHLVTVLLSNPNLLILDEPTNDLDLPTITLLEDFLLHFAGCLIVVTHDRYLLDRLVDHLFIFRGQGQIQDFNGNYREWRAQEQAQAAEAARLQREQHKAQTTPAQQNRPTRKADKRTYRQEQEYNALGAELEQLQARKAELEQRLNSGGLDHDDLAQLAAELQALADTLDEKELRWLELDELGG